MRHKWCVVPLCKNTTARTPNKIFITVPREQDIRKKWLRAMKREDMSIKSTYYCCEDHFNLEEDIENFMKFSLVGGPIFLKKHVVPHKFDCQIKITTSNRKPRKAKSKKKCLTVIDGDEIVERAISESSEPEFSCSPATSIKPLKIVLNNGSCKPEPSRKRKKERVEKKSDHIIRTIVGGQILEERFRESATDESESDYTSESDNMITDEGFDFSKSKADGEILNDGLDLQFSENGCMLTDRVVEQTYRNPFSNHTNGHFLMKKCCGVQASVKTADKGVQFPTVRNYKKTRDAACSPIAKLIDYVFSTSSDDNDSDE